MRSYEGSAITGARRSGFWKRHPRNTAAPALVLVVVCLAAWAFDHEARPVAAEGIADGAAHTRGRFGHHPEAMALVALFTVLTLAFTGIAVAGATAGRWVIAIGAAAIAAWMGSFAWSALRRRRR